MVSLVKDHASDTGFVRVAIEHVTPEVDAGLFAVKRIEGQSVTVEADAFTDGHDAVRCVLLHRKESESEWSETEMLPLPNDRWRGEFLVAEIGRYHYTLMAWVDHFLSWRQDFSRRIDKGDIANALLVAEQLIVATIARIDGSDANRLEALLDVLRDDSELSKKSEIAMSDTLWRLMARYQERHFPRHYARQLCVVVDRKMAGFSSWYEMFPRSVSSMDGRHGTLKNCMGRLSYVASMGFNVLYLPPLHPIGHINRKGRNNSLEAHADDVGSTWAIGSAEGGHKAVLGELGTLEDLHALKEKARDLDIEIALDIAFQCAPDHPYVEQHAAWFRRRPDGSVQYAENPPKKYQDIYPFDFENDDWWALWSELKSVVEFWIGQGFSLFRVDNPHTKPFPFWEWLIDGIKRDHPGVLFLSEAFTREKVMHRLAKLGFSQSYTYFTWRNTKDELTEYFTEVSHSDTREYFRPNCWPNTPDILPAYLQIGGRPAFMTRLVLAASLCSNYGIYGPAYELIERTPIVPGSEEYRDSEKYQLRHWDINRPDSLSEFIARINLIRRENPALQNDWNLRFLTVDNDELICYGKMTEDLSNIVIAVVNLDPKNRQSGWVEFDPAQFGISADKPYQMHDCLNDKSYIWHGPRNFVILDPAVTQAHIFQLRRWVRSEQNIDYFM
jgi:starch synthase (maltosyl-transferring)